MKLETFAIDNSICAVARDTCRLRSSSNRG